MKRLKKELQAELDLQMAEIIKAVNQLKNTGYPELTQDNAQTAVLDIMRLVGAPTFIQDPEHYIRESLNIYRRILAQRP